MKKSRNLVIFLTGVFALFLIVSLTPKDYEYKYKIGKTEITESYNAESDVYSFSFLLNDETYLYSLSNKYIRERGLIKSLTVKDNCLLAKSDYLDSFSICHKDSEYYTRYYSEEVDSKVIDTYKNINIYNLNNQKYFVWNYTGFLSISDDKKDEIKVFETDLYELELITKLKNYLVVANYDQKYEFDQMYLINSKNNRVKELNLDKKIYFNSYILGIYKKDIYFYDIQKEKEYRVNPFKETVTKNAYEILVDDNWEKVSVNKLNKKDLSFSKKELFGYVLKDNVLYYEMPTQMIRVTNMEVSNVVESNEKEAYFISGDTLYHVDFDKGIKKIMSYSEWNFNNKNIYIFE